MSKAETEFEDYVRKYCTKHKISPEEAKKHKLVQDAKTYYFKDKYGDRID